MAHDYHRLLLLDVHDLHIQHLPLNVRRHKSRLPQVIHRFHIRHHPIPRRSRSFFVSHYSLERAVRPPLDLPHVVFVLIISYIPSAVGKNIETVLVCRFLNGLAGAAALSVPGGTLRDIFEPHQLQTPMAVFSASPFMGATLGPIIGGFINYFGSTWRWTYCFLTI
ncbi:hypothetical protein VTI74DRAFT_3779 [Chaetomium olivicolor]